MNLPLAPPPFPMPDGSLTARTMSVVYTGTACLALMDTAHAADVWDDILYDGVDHEHGPGGLMMNAGSAGTHLDHDGEFPVTVGVDEEGHVVALLVDLDPYRDDLDSLRRPVHWSAEDEEHGHGHSHGHAVDGWSEPVTVALTSATAVFGDPAGLPQADNTGGLLDLTFPAAGGRLHLSVYHEGGLRRSLLVTWTN